MKACNRCKNTLPISAFNRDKTRSKDGYARTCRECRRIIKIKSRYNAEASALLVENCQCCDVKLVAGNKGGNRMVIDHCHDTNAFRGVICNECNLVLGFAHDNLDRLGMAVAYLRKHNKEV